MTRDNKASCDAAKCVRHTEGGATSVAVDLEVLVVNIVTCA